MNENRTTIFLKHYDVPHTEKIQEYYCFVWNLKISGRFTMKISWCLNWSIAVLDIIDIDYCDIHYFQTALFSDFSILSLAEALANIYILVCNLKRTFLLNLLYKHMVAKDEQ